MLCVIRPLTTGRQAGEFHKDRKDGKLCGQWDSPPTLRALDPAQESSLGQRVLRTYFSLWTLLYGVPSTQCQSPSLPALVRPIQ